MYNLFLTSEKSSKKYFGSIIKKSVKAIVGSQKTTKAYSGLTPDELKKVITLDELLPESGLGFDKTLELVSKKILPNLLNVTSTDYMAHLHSPPLMESISSELILSVFNQSMDSWDQAPVATEVELEVIKKICKIYGYNDKSDGIFTSGGTQSNLMGIMIGRDWFCNTVLTHDIKALGLPSNYNKFRIYTSEISHFSVEKSANMLGLGYNSVIKVPVDDKQKMDIDVLRRIIKDDLENGLLPICIIATIGTTDYGSIDPLADISNISKEFNIWLHGDAAYGSGLILSESYSNRIDGINLCDSITIDFHKMFMMPISCGAFILKNGDYFKSLTLHTDYLNREEDEEEGYTNLVGKSLQTTRRFDALKVWMIFQSFGKNRLSDIIDKSVDNANYVYHSLMNRDEFEVVVKPEISSVVFRLIDNCDINKRVRKELIHTHGIVIGQTIFDGKVYLKLTLLNPLLTKEHLDNLLDLISKVSKQYRKSL